MGVTTKRGDGGTTSLFNGERVRKNHPVVDAVGIFDELTSRLGLAKCYAVKFEPEITKIQKNLMQLAGYLSSKGETDCNYIDSEQNYLDSLTETYSAQIGKNMEFTIPGIDIPSSFLHICRTECRKFERALISIEGEFALDARVIKYINRLSDVLFLMATIYENETKGKNNA